MADILLHFDNHIFSYRVAGILIINGKVLLQAPKNQDQYAFPGGHVAFGETNAETLIREWREEIGVDIDVSELKWIEENIFLWGGKNVHQICLSYIVELKDVNQIPHDGSFMSKEYGDQNGESICFHWAPMEDIKDLTVYPVNAAELLTHLDDGIRRLVYQEDDKMETDPPDITLHISEGIFNLRVGALIMKNNSVLMVINNSSSFYYSVGGRVKLCEALDHAVVREALEETGEALDIDRLVWIHENFFTAASGETIGRRYHEISFFYLMKLNDGTNIASGSYTNDGARLAWLPIDKLDEYELYPGMLKNGLRKLPVHPMHVITRG